MARKKAQQAAASRIISKEMKKGTPHRKAVAIGLSKARSRKSGQRKK